VEGSIVVGRITDNKVPDLRLLCAVRAALQNAASVAGLLVTTEAMITEAPKKESARRCRAAAAWGAWAEWTTKPILELLHSEGVSVLHVRGPPVF
jgi:hypothetical protein